VIFFFLNVFKIILFSERNVDDCEDA